MKLRNCFGIIVDEVSFSARITGLNDVLHKEDDNVQKMFLNIGH